jgi:hypothetical protein
MTISSEVSMLRFLVIASALLSAFAPRLVAEQPRENDGAKPPYERMLTGDDAKKAADFEKKMIELAAADNYDDAVTLWRELLELRTKVQGADHWQTADVKWRIDQLRKVAALPTEKRAGWRMALQGALSAEPLEAKSAFAQALPLRQAYSTWCREVLGEEHPDTAQSYYALNRNWNGQGEYAEAERVSRKALSIRIKMLGEEHPETANSYTAVAVNLDNQGKHAAAQPLYRMALTICQKVLGEEHRHTANAFNNVALNLSFQAKYAAAEPLFRQALAIRTKLFGEEHLETAKSSQGLALNLSSLGKYADAETLERKALAIRVKVLGEENVDTAETCLNLAFDVQHQSKYLEAESLYRRAMTIYVKVLGAEHPLTSSSYSNLAANLNVQGKYADAEPLQRKALAIRIKTLGEEHPDTGASLNNLAVTLDNQSKFAEAEPLYRKALIIAVKALGEQHPHTAASFNNLAFVLDAQGKYAEAAPLYNKALAIRRSVLGEEHPDTAASYNNIGSNLADQGKWAEAEPLYRKALALRLKALGEERAETATSYNNVAFNLNHQGKFADAELLFRRALALRLKVLGEEHPDTCVSYNNLAGNLNDRGRSAEAEKLYRKALAIRVKVLGDEHVETANSYRNLSHSLSAQRKYADAEALDRKALAICIKTLGEEHPDTGLSYNNLAAVLAAQGQYAEAEALGHKGLAIYVKTLGEEHPLTALSFNNIAIDLHALGKYADAAALLERSVHTYEASRLAVAVQGLERAEFGVQRSPYQQLAAALARLDRPADAWAALEAGLARGLLDQLGPASGDALAPDEEAKRRELAGRLGAFEPRLLRLSAALKRNAAEETERKTLLGERQQASSDLAALAAALSKRQVASLAQLQATLATDAAWVSWLDLSDYSGAVREHWACVVRRNGQPLWRQLPGSGPDGKWTKDDGGLPTRLRKELTSGSNSAAVVAELSRQLRAQRLAPIEKDLQGVKRLFVSATQPMGGIPVEALTDQFTICYVPSGTFLARLKDKPVPGGSGLLALGDPIFKTSSGPAQSADLPSHGLLILSVVPGGPGAKAGLKEGDVLLSYAGEPLHILDDLTKFREANAAAKSVEVKIWRPAEQDKVNSRDVPTGLLGIVLDKRPAPRALADRRKADELLVASRYGDKLTELPGTRVEVTNLAKLFGAQTTLLVDSDASEQRLEELRASGALGQFRYLHFGTHGAANDVKEFESVLYLAQDKLAKEPVVSPGKPLINGELSAREVLEHWKLSADLVTLSACETALGRQGGGDGLLGFAQAFLTAGSRSVCLSLWKVDDAATALLMDRFYQNLLGKREGLTQALPKAEALAEAKSWLRNLTVDQVAERTAVLTQGVARGKDQPALKIVTPEKPKGESGNGAKPFAHPRYWAAFILIGSPN